MTALIRGKPMSYLESLRVFVRVVELGSITAGGRDLRLTPAVASKRVKELEARLGVRLLNRTTRSLTPTEAGEAYFDYAQKVIEALEASEAVIAGISGQPQGAIRVAAPLGIGRRIVAPLVPVFTARYPGVELRLRLSDRKVDMLADRQDVSFFLGVPQDSALKFRKIMDCPRVLCAAPGYLARHGTPAAPQDLLRGHNCLLLRYPRSPEYFWTLHTAEGPRKLEVAGRFDADDADVLTGWALDGHGIVNLPRFEAAAHLASGALIEVLPATPPVPVTFGCLYPHRRFQDPKIRLFSWFRSAAAGFMV
jgi:DNA-binding transcriptional LysR family regulator